MKIDEKPQQLIEGGQLSLVQSRACGREKGSTVDVGFGVSGCGFRGAHSCMVALHGEHEGDEGLGHGDRLIGKRHLDPPSTLYVTKA